MAAPIKKISKSTKETQTDTISESKPQAKPLHLPPGIVTIFNHPQYEIYDVKSPSVTLILNVKNNSISDDQQETIYPNFDELLTHLSSTIDEKKFEHLQ